MEILINLFVFVASCFLIIKATEMFVSGAIYISEYLRLSKVLIAVTVVSLVTTAPELIVSVSSNFLKEPGMAFGNAVGSCMCNFGLIFAGSLIVRNILINREDIFKILFYLGGLLLLFVFFLNKALGRAEGIVLVLLAVGFMAYQYFNALKGRQKIEVKDAEKLKRAQLVFRGTFYILAGGIATVLIARYGLVDRGIFLAKVFHVPSVLIGLTLMSIGTSIPELSVAFVSIKKGHGEIAFGNVIGANILNVLWVLGFAAVTKPVHINYNAFFFNILFAIALAVVMFIIARFNSAFNRLHGIILLSIYVIYLIVAVKLYGFSVA